MILSAACARWPEQMAGRPGVIEAGPWQEPGSDCVIGISKWTSREAFLATGITLEPSDEIPPGETRPRQRFLLEDAVASGGGAV